MKLGFTFLGMLLCMQFGLYGQNAIFGADFANGWANATTESICFDGSAGGSRIGVFQPNGENGNKFLRLVTCWDGNENQWGPNVDGAIMVIGQEFTAYAQRDFNAFQVENTDISNNYVFKTRAGGNPPSPLGVLVFEVQGDIRTISSITQSLDDENIFFDEEVTVTATLDANLNTGQAVYFRYSTDNFASSTVVNMTGSGSSYSATIPSSTNSAGATINYYVFTSGTDASNNPLTITPGDSDFFTINLNNNSGSNYSYTVRSEYITQSGATNWNSAASWRAGEIPPNDADVIIAHDLSLTDDREVESIEINSGASLSFLDNETLSIGDNGTLNNDGTLNHTNGTINFLGNASISGTLSLNDVVLNNGGVSFETTTITGSLTLNAGSFVDTDSPIYGTESTLIYNIGDAYVRGIEWNNSNTSTSGTPHHVEITNGTALNMSTESFPFTGDVEIPGNLVLNGGTLDIDDFNTEISANNIEVINNGSIEMGSTNESIVARNDFNNLNGTVNLSTLFEGDLVIRGENFVVQTENSTLNSNGRAVFFEGDSDINVTSDGEIVIDFVVINKASGKVIVDNNLHIAGQNGVGTQGTLLSMGSNSVLDLNGFNLKLGSGDANDYGIDMGEDTNIISTPSTEIEILNNGTTGLRFDQSENEMTNAVKSLVINNSGTVQFLNNLYVFDKLDLDNASVEANNYLIFKSNSDKTAIISEVKNNGSISGNIRVERYFSDVNRSFRYVSSPVSSTEGIRANWQEGVNNTGTNYPADNENPNPGFGTHITGSTSGADGFDATLTGNPSLFTWDNESQTWSAIPNTNATNLEAGKAYALMVRGDRSTNLSSNDAQGGATVLRSLGNPEVGTFSIPSSEMPKAAEEFALIGNPYQAQVNVKNITTTGLNTNFMYIWDPNIGETGGYTAIDLTEDPVTTTPASAANERLQPSQAFFMETSAATSSVSFEESHKTEEILNTSTFSVTTTAQIYATLTEENSPTTIDAARVVFNEAFSEEVNVEDAKKLWNNAEYLAISKPNYWLMVEKKTLTENDTIQLFTGNYFASEYQLAIDVNNIDTHDVFLRDRYLDEVYALGNASIYVHNFNVDYAITESVANERFQLILKEIPLSTISEIQPEIKIYPNPVSNGKISIENTFQQGEEINLVIYDLLGRAMISSDFKANSNFIEMDVSSLKTGLFILQLKSETGVLSHKLIVE